MPAAPMRRNLRNRVVEIPAEVEEPKSKTRATKLVAATAKTRTTHRTRSKDRDETVDATDTVDVPARTTQRSHRARTKEEANAKVVKRKATKVVRRTRAHNDGDEAELQTSSKEPVVRQRSVRQTRAHDESLDPEVGSQTGTEEAPKGTARVRKTAEVHPSRSSNKEDDVHDKSKSRSTKVKKETQEESADEPVYQTRGRSKKNTELTATTKTEAVDHESASPKRRPGIRAATASTTAKAKKKVAFKLDDNSDKENVPTSVKSTGMRARPIRKAITKRVTTRGKRTTAKRATKNNGNKRNEMPLSPKKDKQVTKVDPYMSEDELVRAEYLLGTPYKSPVKRLPSKEPRADTPKEDFTLPRPAENSATFTLASPARRPPPSPFKNTLRESPKKLPITNMPQGPTIGVASSPLKKSLLHSPARRPPSPVKSLGSPAKQNSNPFVRASEEEDPFNIPASPTKSAGFTSPAKRSNLLFSSMKLPKFQKEASLAISPKKIRTLDSPARKAHGIFANVFMPVDDDEEDELSRSDIIPIMSPVKRARAKSLLPNIKPSAAPAAPSPIAPKVERDEPSSTSKRVVSQSEAAEQDSNSPTCPSVEPVLPQSTDNEHVNLTDMTISEANHMEVHSEEVDTSSFQTTRSPERSVEADETMSEEKEEAQALDKVELLQSPPSLRSSSPLQRETSTDTDELIKDAEADGSVHGDIEVDKTENPEDSDAEGLDVLQAELEPKSNVVLTPVKSPSQLYARFTSDALKFRTPAPQTIEDDYLEDDELSTIDQHYSLSPMRNAQVEHEDDEDDITTPVPNRSAKRPKLSLDAEETTSITSLVSKLNGWHTSEKTTSILSPKGPTLFERPNHVFAPESENSPKECFFEEAIGAEIGPSDDILMQVEEAPYAQQSHQESKKEDQEGNKTPLSGDYDSNAEAIEEPKENENANDENTPPTGPFFSTDVASSSDPAPFLTPARQRIPHIKTVHTVGKVPLKPADDDDDVPVPKVSRKRSRSVSGGRVNREALRNLNVEFGTPARKPAPQSLPSATVPESGMSGRSPRRGADAQILKGVVAYVDVYTTEGADASAVFTEVLTDMGARCVKQWSWNPRASMARNNEGQASESKIGITHVIFKDGGVRTLEKVRETHGVVSCVGVGWVLDCERENKWVSESAYAVDISMIPRGGHRRRKSMEPRALANVNGSLVPADLVDATQNLEPLSPTEEFITFSSPAGRRESRRQSFMMTPLPPSVEYCDDDEDDDVLSTPHVTTSDETISFSPTTPYFLSRGANLIQQTCPPKQTNQRLFPLSAEIDEQSNESLRLRLLEARRKSLQFKPKTASPLGRSVSYGRRDSRD